MFKATSEWKRPKAIHRLTCNACGSVFIRRSDFMWGIYRDAMAIGREGIYRFHTVACPSCFAALYFAKRHDPFSEWKPVNSTMRKALITGGVHIRKSNLGIALERNPLD